MISVESRDLTGRASTRRFLLLVMVLLASSTVLLGASVLTLLSLTSLPHCAAEAGVDVHTPAWRALLAVQFHEGLAGCRSGAARTAVYASFWYTCLVSAAALTLYWRLPHWKLRRGRLPLLLAAGASRTAAVTGPPGAPRGREPLASHLAGLVRQAGVPSTSAPTFVVNPRAMSAGAVAFGRAGRYTVCLHAGLLVRRSTDPGQFDAVVLHELAHVRNRDVDLAYLTVALWRVFLALVLGPYLLLNGWLLFQESLLGTERVYWDGGAPGPASFALAAGLVVQTYLARADILRHRELVADHDAVMCGADPSVWGAQRPSRASGATMARLTRIWRSHPNWAERHHTLTCPPVADKGGTKLQLLLFIAAYLTLLITVILWLENGTLPQGVVRSLAYLATPLVIATLIAIRPRRKPEPLELSPAVSAGDDPRRGPAGVHRAPRTRRALTVGFLMMIAFFITDPLAGIGEGPTGEMGPHPLGRWPIRQPPEPPRYDARTRARVVAWYDGGGTGLLKRLEADLSAAGRGMDDSGQAHRDCAALERTMSETLAFPVFPTHEGAESWRLLLTWTTKGYAIQCRSGSQDPGSKLEAISWYGSAQIPLAHLNDLRPTPPLPAPHAPRSGESRTTASLTERQPIGLPEDPVTRTNGEARLEC
ncbi:M56 family metallopeptidase [Streptomyces sp. NPDC059255]|uniref:M56 family metallopeptidase n=1 Tax=Streptomyces sp. NPDC059255 TaxID=3346793 RepID=UPI0036C86FA0